MPEYECDRCHKMFNKKSNYNKHMKRKNPCSLPQFKCEFCSKNFTYKGNLSRHINNVCREKRERDKNIEMEQQINRIEQKVEEQMKEMKEEIKNLETQNKQLQVINSGNVVNNVNINNTIKIVAYGKEDVDSILSNEDFKKILNRGMGSVPELVKRIHFDRNIPVNHNIYISNLRDSYVFTYDGDTWRLNNREETLKNLYGHSSNILINKFEELKDKDLGRKIVEKYERCLDYVEDEEDNHTKEVREELKKLLYENRGIVEQTKKQLQQH